MVSILKSKKWIPDSHRVEIGIWKLEVRSWKFPKLQTPNSKLQYPTSKFQILEKFSILWKEFLDASVI